MKKLLITLFFCTAAFTSCSSSRVSLMGRLGLLGIFQRAHRSSAIVASRKAIVAPRLPLYTNKHVAIREFLPVQPSPDSALAREGLELLTNKLTAPIKAFRDSFKIQYRDPLIERDLANAHRMFNTAQRGERAARNSLREYSLRPRASAAA